jgi:hypothetical protein
MSRRIRRFVVAAIVAGAAHADITALPPYCKLVPANATLTLAAGMMSVYATSATNYAVSPCFRYVIDVNVPYTSLGGKSWAPEFNLDAYDAQSLGGPQLDVSEPECNAWFSDVTYYKWSASQGQFVYIGGGHSHAIWQPGTYSGTCTISPDADYEAPPMQNPPAFQLLSRYRIAISARTRSVRSVTAGAYHKLVVPPLP